MIQPIKERNIRIFYENVPNESANDNRMEEEFIEPKADPFIAKLIQQSLQVF